MGKKEKIKSINKSKSKKRPNWEYNEMNFCGAEFSNYEVAKKYDKRHEKFRDYKKQTEQIVSLLGLGRRAFVIDLGCGTGAFAVNAAAYYQKIYAVDISEAMLRVAREKSEEAAISNIEFLQGGFLTYEHRAKPVDAVVTSVALHHLPDFWKLIALKRIAKMLNKGGKLLLFDVVFSFDTAEYQAGINEFINIMVKQAGRSMKKAAEMHIRQEYSTLDWIMEGLIEKAGFAIEKTDYKDGVFANYLCTKKD